MGENECWIYPGGDDAVRAALRAEAPGELRAELVGGQDPRQVVLFLQDGSIDASRLQVGGAGHNVFSLCRMLKERQPESRVFLILDGADRFGAEIGRFCLADDCLRRRADGGVDGLERVEHLRLVTRGRVLVPELLARYEQELEGDPAGLGETVRRLLDETHEDWMLAHLSDAETGLYAARFASFKVDEEFKRARRFHQPLSLMLFDVGLGDGALGEGSDPGTRRALFAELASIFLNECRDIDLVARVAEGVFLLLLPGTGRDGAVVLARRLLGEISRRELSVPVVLQPAVGVSTAPAAHLRTRQEFLLEAQLCLHRARTDEATGGLATSWSEA